MVKCSECKYLEERTRVVYVSSRSEDLSGPLLHTPPRELGLGPGPISPYAGRTISVPWFTCRKVNKNISKKYRFREGYEIPVHELNDDRDCPDFEKK